jgi:hypothetical protein
MLFVDFSVHGNSLLLEPSKIQHSLTQFPELFAIQCVHLSATIQQLFDHFLSSLYETGWL